MTRMVVCNKVSEGLWQVGANHWPDDVPDVDVVIHAWPLPIATDGHPPLGTTLYVSVSFGDHDHGPIDGAVIDTLRALAKAHAHRRVMTVCKEGKNRSGLMSALILMERGMDTEDAIALVKERASLPGSVEALSNRVFLAKLREAVND